MDSRIARDFEIHQVFVPVILPEVGERSNNFFYLAVGNLRLSICLEMMGCGLCALGAEKSEKGFPRLIDK